MGNHGKTVKKDVRISPYPQVLRDNVTRGRKYMDKRFGMDWPFRTDVEDLLDSGKRGTDAAIRGCFCMFCEYYRYGTIEYLSMGDRIQYGLHPPIDENFLIRNGYWSSKEIWRELAYIWYDRIMTLRSRREGLKGRRY